MSDPRKGTPYRPRAGGVDHERDTPLGSKPLGQGEPKENTYDGVRHHVARVDFNPLTFGQMLRVLMVERSLTLAHMAALTGLHPNVLSKIRLASDPNSAMNRQNRGVFRPTAETIARIIRGLNVIYPVPPPHVVLLFIKCGHAPPMPFVVSAFSTSEQIIVAFDGRAWIPEGGVHHDGEPARSAEGGVWSQPAVPFNVIRRGGLVDEIDRREGGAATAASLGAPLDPDEREPGGPAPGQQFLGRRRGRRPARPHDDGGGGGAAQGDG